MTLLAGAPKAFAQDVRRAPWKPAVR